MARALSPGADNPDPPPPPQGAPPVNPMCPRLEAQLATIDRGGSGDPAKDDQIRRYQDAAAKQQGELDRVTSQAKRMGCDSSGFFSLFSGQSAQCGPVNNQIQQMRANLDQINSSLAQLRGGAGGADRDNQRRSVLIALAQNNCGPQYAAARAGPGQFPQQSVRRTTIPGNPASARRSRSAIRHLPHRVRPQLRRLLFPDLVRHRARRFRTTRRPARRCARPPRPRCSPTATPAKTSARRCRSTASPIRRCRTRSVTARNSIRPAPARPPGQTWSDALKERRRQGRRRTAGRHHRHRRERQEDVAGAEPSRARPAKKGADPATKAPPRRRLTIPRTPPATAGAAAATNRSARSARPSSPRARSRPVSRSSRRTPRPIRGWRATPARRRARATACRHRETGW